jgi:hypothetical protein
VPFLGSSQSFPATLQTNYFLNEIRVERGKCFISITQYYLVEHSCFSPLHCAPCPFREHEICHWRRSLRTPSAPVTVDCWPSADVVEVSGVDGIDPRRLPGVMVGGAKPSHKKVLLVQPPP